MRHAKPPKRSVYDALLNRLPFWQGMGFVLMICMLWAVRAFGVAEFFFNGKEVVSGWIELSLFTVVVIIMGFVIVGYSYVQQKRILQGVISVCSYCKKAHVKETADWITLESYISDRSLADFSHGICPDCYRRVMDEMRGVEMAEEELTAAAPADR